MAQRLIDATRFERRLMFTVDRDEICDDCLRNFLNEMAKEPTIDPVKHGRWRSIKDDFPEKDGRYLVYEPGVGVYDAFTTLQNGKYFWWENSLKPRNVTHWMQLPEPPTGAMDTDE